MAGGYDAHELFSTTFHLEIETNKPQKGDSFYYKQNVRVVLSLNRAKY